MEQDSKYSDTILVLPNNDVARVPSLERKKKNTLFELVFGCHFCVGILLTSSPFIILLLLLLLLVYYYYYY